MGLAELAIFVGLARFALCRLCGILWILGLCKMSVFARLEIMRGFFGNSRKFIPQNALYAWWIATRFFAKIAHNDKISEFCEFSYKFTR